MDFSNDNIMETISLLKISDKGSKLLDMLVAIHSKNWTVDSDSISPLQFKSNNKNYTGPLLSIQDLPNYTTNIEDALELILDCYFFVLSKRRWHEYPDVRIYETFIKNKEHTFHMSYQGVSAYHPDRCISICMALLEMVIKDTEYKIT